MRRRITAAISAEESRETMRARPEVRDILIALKLRFWSLRARYPSAYPNCSPSRARRNFLRLLARHQKIARRLNLDLRSACRPYEKELRAAREALNKKVVECASRNWKIGCQELARMFKMSPAALYGIARGHKPMQPRTPSTPRWCPTSDVRYPDTPFR